MSESRRAALRIASNYVRMIGTVLMGLLVVRLLLHAIGGEAVGLVALLGSTMGLATVIEESVENSMVRELGRAHHSGDVSEFLRMYNSALATSVAAGACSLVLFAAILALLPLLAIGDELLGAARWFVIAKAVESLVVVVCSPAYNMYLVTERMVRVNLWMLVRRGTALFGAIITLWLGFSDPADGLLCFAWSSTAAHVLVMFVAVGLIMISDPRTRPAPRLASRAACSEIVRASGVNASMYATQLLQVPACSVLMNLAFGLNGNLVFGLAVQMAGYVRTAAFGLVSGIDAVAARLATAGASPQRSDRLRTLVYHATRLQAFIAIPAGVCMFVIAPSFLRVWVAGESVTEELVHDAVLLSRTLTVGIVAQCMLDAWWRVLYGAGHVAVFARTFAPMAAATTPLAACLFWALPGDTALLGPAFAYSILNLILAMVMMPRRVARVFGMRTATLLGVIMRPLAPSILAGVCAHFLALWLHWPPLAMLLVSGTSFGVVYAMLAYYVALESMDRERVSRLGRGVHARILARQKNPLTRESG